MSTQVQFRRGTTLETTNFTGASGEVTVDTTKNVCVVHDASKAGGYPLMREDGVNSALVLGSPANCSLKFVNNPNTGIYSPGVDQVAIATAGVQRLLIDASGNITNPGALTAASFIPTGASAPINGLYLPGANQVALSTGGTGRLFVDASGNIGHGSAPSTSTGRLIDINGVSIQPILQLRASSSTVATTSYTLDTVNSLVSFISSDWPIRYYINGTERLRITSAGIVSIGTSSPNTAYRQTINGNGSTVVGGLSLQNNGTETLTIGNVTAANDVDTELWNPRNGYLRFATNNLERLRITSAGLVGIGTSSPASLLCVGGNTPTAGKLSVVGDASGVSFAASDNTSSSLYIKHQSSGCATFGTDAGGAIAFATNGFTEKVRIDSSGRLLVGTSSARLYTSLGYAKFQVEGTDFAGSSIGLTNNQATVDGSYLVFNKTRGTSVGSNTLVNNGDLLGSIWFQGSDGTGQVRGAVIQAYVDGTPGISDMPGALSFLTTADGASSPTERMRIGQNGKTTITHTNNDAVLITAASATSGYTSRASQILFDGYAPNNTSAQFLYCADTAAIRAQIYSNGGIANYQANDVNLSDINAKKDIGLAAGTWDCIKEWEIVNYRYKDQPDDSALNLGVIAQQINESCPELVAVFEEAKDDKPEKLGVKEQQMYWMTVKALQEAMERIEQLEQRLADAGIA